MDYQSLLIHLDVNSRVIGLLKFNERRIITLLNVRGNAVADPGISRPGARYDSWGLGIVLMYLHAYCMYMLL